MKSSDYLKKLQDQISILDVGILEKFYKTLVKCYKKKNRVYICGNGGSAANANHIANDFMLGINDKKIGIPVISLCSNVAVITCLGNDINYSEIFSNQIKSLGKSGDILIVLSGSGNSQNIINAIKASKRMGIFVFGMIGYNGGKAKKLLKNYIHFNVNDMQISEDMQMICSNYILKKFIK